MLSAKSKQEENPYDVLGISKSDTKEVIRKKFIEALKKINRQKHHDIAAEEKIQKITTAYNKLCKEPQPFEDDLFSFEPIKDEIPPPTYQEAMNETPSSDYRPQSVYPSVTHRRECLFPYGNVKVKQPYPQAAVIKEDMNVPPPPSAPKPAAAPAKKPVNPKEAKHGPMFFDIDTMGDPVKRARAEEINNRKLAIKKEQLKVNSLESKNKLIHAIANGKSCEHISGIIDGSSDPNILKTCDQEGNSLVHIACLMERIDVVKLLCGKTYNKNYDMLYKKNNEGLDPICFALQMGLSENCLKTLEHLGSNMQGASTYYFTSMLNNAFR